MLAQRFACALLALSLLGCDGNILIGDGTDDGDGVDDPGDPSGGPPETPVGRLTNAEYVATVEAAFEAAMPAITLPSDGNDGVFTSNGASDGIGDFNGYVLASEAYGAALAPGLVAACDWAADTAGCAEQVFAPVLPTLFRGSATPGDYDELAQLITAAVDDGATLEVALTGAVSRVLLDERFLFHIEYGDGAGDDPRALSLSGPELAARMSYLLLDGPPDASLLEAASGGFQRDPNVVEIQAQRLFGEASARDQLWRFASEWLGIPTDAPVDEPPQVPAGDQCDFTSDCVAIYGAEATDCVNSGSDQSWCSCGGAQCTAPPTEMSLARSMHEETRRFVEHIIFDSDAPLSELFTANYSFINAALAAHYGVPAPATDWQRYEFPPEAQRRGVLTHASFLTANGKHARDVSWIFRGKIVYERLFCGKLPPPPPDAVEQEVDSREDHPTCGGCHGIVDPIGRIFDGYDDHGALIGDAAGDARVGVGSDVDGDYRDPVAFADAVAHSQTMSECFAQMWFRFALARKPAAVDDPSFERVAGRITSGVPVRNSMMELLATPAFATLYLAPEDQVCR